MNSKKAEDDSERLRKRPWAEHLEALKAEPECQLVELVRRRLALPIEQRINFLRVRLPGGGSAL
jgi:hypothetical protein